MWTKVKDFKFPNFTGSYYHRMASYDWTGTQPSSSHLASITVYQDYDGAFSALIMGSEKGLSALQAKLNHQADAVMGGKEDMWVTLRSTSTCSSEAGLIALVKAFADLNPSFKEKHADALQAAIKEAANTPIPEQPKLVAPWAPGKKRTYAEVENNHPNQAVPVAPPVLFQYGPPVTPPRQGRLVPVNK